MTKKNPGDDPEKKPNGRHIPKSKKHKLDRFLASICEAGGMTGRGNSGEKPNEPSRDPRRLVCQGPCEKADWRGHLDINGGILCVSAAWSKSGHAEKHRDVTVGVTFRDQTGAVQYNELVFCDSEVRWLMETLWHAPLWEE